MESPSYSELAQPLPRAVRRRWHTFDGEYDPNFNPWITWDIGWKTLAGGLICLGLGWSGSQFLQSFLPLALSFFGGIVSIFGFLLSAGGLAGAQRLINGERFLVSEGQIAIATVTELVGNERMMWDFKYEFCSLEGKKVRGFTSTRFGNKQFQRLGKGGTFVVLYSPKNPKHHVPYEMAIYQAVTPIA